MTCPYCSCDVIENLANFKKFWFCTRCRIEVSPLKKPRIEDSHYGVIQRIITDCEDLTEEEEEELQDWLDHVSSLDEDGWA